MNQAKLFSFIYKIKEDNYHQNYSFVFAFCSPRQNKATIRIFFSNCQVSLFYLKGENKETISNFKTNEKCKIKYNFRKHTYIEFTYKICCADPFPLIFNISCVLFTTGDYKFIKL